MRWWVCYGMNLRDYYIQWFNGMEPFSRIFSVFFIDIIYNFKFKMI